MLHVHSEISFNYIHCRDLSLDLKEQQKFFTISSEKPLLNILQLPPRLGIVF